MTAQFCQFGFFDFGDDWRLEAADSLFGEVQGMLGSASLFVPKERHIKLIQSVHAYLEAAATIDRSPMHLGSLHERTAGLADIARGHLAMWCKQAEAVMDVLGTSRLTIGKAVSLLQGSSSLVSDPSRMDELVKKGSHLEDRQHELLHTLESDGEWAVKVARGVSPDPSPLFRRLVALLKHARLPLCRVGVIASRV